MLAGAVTRGVVAGRAVGVALVRGLVSVATLAIAVPSLPGAAPLSGAAVVADVFVAVVGAVGVAVVGAAVVAGVPVVGVGAVGVAGVGASWMTGAAAGAGVGDAVDAVDAVRGGVTAWCGIPVTASTLTAPIAMPTSTITDTIHGRSIDALVVDGESRTSTLAIGPDPAGISRGGSSWVTAGRATIGIPISDRDGASTITRPRSTSGGATRD